MLLINAETAKMDGRSDIKPRSSNFLCYTHNTMFPDTIFSDTMFSRYDVPCMLTLTAIFSSLIVAFLGSQFKAQISDLYCSLC